MQNPPNNNEPIIDEEKGPTIAYDAYEKVRHLNIFMSISYV